jgi:hypothetical protein
MRKKSLKVYHRVVATSLKHWSQRRRRESSKVRVLCQMKNEQVSVSRRLADIGSSGIILIKEVHRLEYISGRRWKQEGREASERWKWTGPSNSA